MAGSNPSQGSPEAPTPSPSNPFIHNAAELNQLINDAQFFIHNRINLDKANILNTTQGNALAYDLVEQLTKIIHQIKANNLSADTTQAEQLITQLNAPSQRPAGIPHTASLHHYLATLQQNLQEAEAEFAALENGPELVWTPETEEQEETEE